MRFGGGCWSSNGYSDKRLDKPYCQPGPRRNLSRCEKSRRKCGYAHSYSAPSRDGSELRSALHRFADVFKMVGGASVYGDRFALVRTERTSGYHMEILPQESRLVKYF